MYLNCVYASAERTERLQQAWKAAGRKLDMGKSCLRMKREDDLVAEALAEAIRAVPVETFIAEYEAGRTT